MKKNIGYINIDSSLAEFLSDKLREAEHNLAGASELRSAFTELRNGNMTAVMLEYEEEKLLFSDDVKIEYKELEIYPKARKVIRSGEEISLTPKEFDILCFLARNSGEVFSKQQIYQAVWDEDYFLDDSNIMAFIRKLRKKIERNPDAPEYILTIWGIGYKFNDKP